MIEVLFKHTRVIIVQDNYTIHINILYIFETLANWLWVKNPQCIISVFSAENKVNQVPIMVNKYEKKNCNGRLLKSNDIYDMYSLMRN